MAFTKLENGTARDADEVMQNVNALSKHLIISRLNHERTATADRVTGDGFAHLFLDDQTDESYVDTGSTTCYHDERGLVAFCDVLDLFEDGSVDSSIWSESESAGGGNNQALVDEQSGYLRVWGEQYEGPLTTSHATSDGASGLNLAGSDVEVVMTVQVLTTEVRTSVGAGGWIILTDGSSEVTLRSYNESASATEKLIISYDDTNDLAYVSVDGADFGSSIDVSSLGANRYLRFKISTYGNNNEVGTYDMRIYGVGYRKDGASAGNAVFETASQTIDSSDAGIVYADWDTAPTSTPTAALSMDGGSNYGADDVYGAWTSGLTAGTSLQAKFTVAKPTTITPNTKSIPVMIAWGALYE